MGIRRKSLVAFLAVGVASLFAAESLAEPSPWYARRRPGLRANFAAIARIAPDEWPDEPASPSAIDPVRFAKAIRKLCGWMPRKRAQKYAGWIEQYAREFGEDPFLIAALMYRQSRCRPRHEEFGGLGLTLIRREMHAGMLRRGKYTYKVRMAGEWEERTKVMDKFPFGGPRLLRAEENIYFTAGILSVLRDQHKSVDAAFKQRNHRHHVSHFIWGDRVRSHREEDGVFIDRRRLLEYYGHRKPKTHSYLGLTVSSPLDGSPRVLSSGIGDDRDGGKRSHRGVDFESLPGEPVRAIADGVVVFAGVDLPGPGNNVQVMPGKYSEYPRRTLGRGGRFVCIKHPRPGRNSVRSCYMHLEEVNVQARQEVKRGDVLGNVGRTGMKSSAAHLHFEVHDERGVLDARKELPNLAVGDPFAPPAYPPRKPDTKPRKAKKP